MSDVVTGILAILGTILGSLITGCLLIRSKEKEKESERKNNILSKKEKLYIRVIKELKIPETLNPHVSTDDDNQFTKLKNEMMADELFNIEADMQLYAPKHVREKYILAVDAHKFDDTPQDVIEQRYEDLIKAMRKDLGIEH